MLDVEKIRRDFPILAVEVHPGVPLVYLDSAATSQKPRAVIGAMDAYYERYNANVHRGIHRLSEDATAAYEGARARIAAFINAPDPAQVIFTRNATEALNLVAYSWGRENLRPGDEILLTEMEHHANIVPWQMIAGMTGATVRYLPIDDEGLLRLDLLPELSDRADAPLCLYRRVQRAGHDHARCRARGPGARGRRPGPGRRGAKRAPYAGGRAGAGL